MQFIKTILYFNTENNSVQEKRHITIVNTIAILCFVGTTAYSLYYLIGLKSFIGFLATETFALLYLLYFLHFKRYGHYSAIRVLTINFLVHISTIVIFFTSNKSGFHYYLLLVVPMAHFLVTQKNRKFQIIVSAIGLLLFLLCELAGTRYNIFDIPESRIPFLYFSTIGTVFLVFLLFSQVYVRSVEFREAELKKAIDEIRQLSGLLPICAHCKKVKDDSGYWNQIETYIEKHSEAQFSHGLCPDCMKEIYPIQFDKMQDGAEKKR